MIKEFENYINNKIYYILDELITNENTSIDEKIYCIMLMIENKLLNADEGISMAFDYCKIKSEKIKYDKHIRAFTSSRLNIGELIQKKLRRMEY